MMFQYINKTENNKKIFKILFSILLPLSFIVKSINSVITGAGILDSFLSDVNNSSSFMIFYVILYGMFEFLIFNFAIKFIYKNVNFSPYLTSKDIVFGSEIFYFYSIIAFAMIVKNFVLSIMYLIMMRFTVSLVLISLLAKIVCHIGFIIFIVLAIKKKLNCTVKESFVCCALPSIFML